MLLRRSDILTLEGGGAKLIPLRRIYNSQLRGGWDWPWQQYDEYGLEETATLLAKEVVRKARNGCRYEDTLKTFRECCRKAMDKEIIRAYVQDSGDKDKKQRYKETMAQQASAYRRWRLASVCVYGTAALALAALAYYYMRPTPDPEAPPPPPPLTCPTLQHPNPAGTACEKDTFVQVTRDAFWDLVKIGNKVFDPVKKGIEFGRFLLAGGDLAEKYMRMLLKRVIPKGDPERKALLDKILPKPKQKKEPKKKKTVVVVDTQCLCRKKDGIRCSYRKQPGLNFCGFHKDCKNTIVLRGGVERTYGKDVKEMMKESSPGVVAFNDSLVYRVDMGQTLDKIEIENIIKKAPSQLKFLLYDGDDQNFKAWIGTDWVVVDPKTYRIPKDPYEV